MEEKQEKKAKVKNEVMVYRAWCKRCYICVSFCPRDALRINSDGYPYGDPERCIGCGACEIRCPDFAINLKPVPLSDEEPKDSPPEEEPKDANPLENSKEDEEKSEKSE